MENFRQQIQSDGYCRLDGQLYDIRNESLLELQESYYRLSKDNSHGARFRAHSRFRYSENGLELTDSGYYAQSSSYNDEDGGKLREFQPIENDVANSTALRHLVERDIELSMHAKQIDFGQRVNIGIHQIRYCGSSENPSYSSPLWLHKDDEPLVFIHLINLSGNAVGGDNLIARGLRKIDKVYHLNCPLDTLVVTQSHYHAVTPVGSVDNSMSFRDVVLVTFDNEDDMINRLDPTKRELNHAKRASSGM